jgi:hypothetical protein
MAFLGETFSVDSLPVSDRSYDLVPEGWYTATITKADINMTKSGTGQKLDMRYDITGPTHEGRVIFGTINIRNQSARAEEIGRQQLGEVLRAIGLGTIQDSDQLIGNVLGIRVKIKHASEADKANGYSDSRNEIGGFRSVSSAPMAAQTFAAAPATPAPAPSAAPEGIKPPWAK